MYFYNNIYANKIDIQGNKSVMFTDFGALIDLGFGKQLCNCYQQENCDTQCISYNNMCANKTGIQTNEVKVFILGQYMY